MARPVVDGYSFRMLACEGYTRPVQLASNSPSRWFSCQAERACITCENLDQGVSTPSPHASVHRDTGLYSPGPGRKHAELVQL
jgi:hypothetical protein